MSNIEKLKATQDPELFFKKRYDVKRYNISFMMLLTLGCSSSCKHCLYASSPLKAKRTMTQSEVRHYLEDARGAGLVSVCFTGGECFLVPDILLYGIFEARALDMRVSIRTNAAWCESDRIARAVASTLKVCGVTDVGLSTDGFHQEFTPVSNVKRLAAACEDIELGIWLDWVGSRADTKARAWRVLGDRFMPAVRNVGTPEFVGRAKSLPDDYFPRYCADGFEFDSCKSFRCDQFCGSLNIYPGGWFDFDNCSCGGPFGIHKIPRNHYWVGDVLERAELSPGRIFLFQHGIGGVIREARVRFPDIVSEKYIDACELCRRLIPRMFPDDCRSAEPAWLRQEDGYSPDPHKAKVMRQAMAGRVLEVFDSGRIKAAMATKLGLRPSNSSSRRGRPGADFLNYSESSKAGAGVTK